MRALTGIGEFGDPRWYEPMATVILGMTTSLDGFVADQDGRAGRLYHDLAALRGTAYMNAVIEETGAVLMGKRTFEMGDPDS